MKTRNNLVQKVLSSIVTINKMAFVGLTYTNKANEKSSYTVGLGFNYANAVQKDLNKLIESDVKELAKSINFSAELVKQAVDKLSAAFIKNQNKETQSAQSIAQQDAYINVCTGVKIHKETENVHLYAMSINKTIIEKGEYKETNKRELTKCQDAIKKALNFSTTKFRNFIVTANQFHKINAQGSKLNFEMI